MMEVPQLRLTLEVLVLLLGLAGAAFPRLHPDRLQFYEYESISVDCSQFTGSSDWRVLMENPTSSYNSSAPTYNIDLAFRRHSGELWCEDAEGNKSSTVSITVTDGSVILDVPARPVVEGHDVTLHCKVKRSNQNIADFYKDGSLFKTRYDNRLTIRTVSKSDEGLYKCISGAGESPQSQLVVLEPGEDAALVTSYPEVSAGQPPPPFSPSPLFSPLLLWVVSLAVSLLVLLLLLGVLIWRKRRVSLSSGNPTPGSAGPRGDRAAPPCDIYSVVMKHSKEPNVSGTDPENDFYSVIQ